MHEFISRFTSNFFASLSVISLQRHVDPVTISIDLPAHDRARICEIGQSEEADITQAIIRMIAQLDVYPY